MKLQEIIKLQECWNDAPYLNIINGFPYYFKILNKHIYFYLLSLSMIDFITKYTLRYSAV